MSDELVVLKTFNNEIEPGMAQQVLQQAGMTAFVFKDDAGGMEPHLQRTNGVRLLVNRSDAERAFQMLKRDLDPAFFFFLTGRRGCRAYARSLTRSPLPD